MGQPISQISKKGKYNRRRVMRKRVDPTIRTSAVEAAIVGVRSDMALLIENSARQMRDQALLQGKSVDTRTFEVQTAALTETVLELLSGRLGIEYTQPVQKRSEVLVP